MGLKSFLIETFMYVVDERAKQLNQNEETNETVSEQFYLNKIKEHEDALHMLHKRIKELERRAFLPSERSHIKQSECSKLNLRSEWESRNFFE